MCMISTKIKLKEKCKEPEMTTQIQSTNKDMGGNALIAGNKITENENNEILRFDKLANVLKL